MKIVLNQPYENPTARRWVRVISQPLVGRASVLPDYQVEVSVDGMRSWERRWHGSNWEEACMLVVEYLSMPTPPGDH